MGANGYTDVRVYARLRLPLKLLGSDEKAVRKVHFYMDL